MTSRYHKCAINYVLPLARCTLSSPSGALFDPLTGVSPLDLFGPRLSPYLCTAHICLYINPYYDVLWSVIVQKVRRNEHILPVPVQPLVIHQIGASTVGKTTPSTLALLSER